MTGEAVAGQGRGARGRVVMLVDNAVDGDSRVQKVARSAADAGWDTVLLGCAPLDAPRTWRLGGAEVRVLPLAGSRAPGAGGPAGLRQRLLARGGLPLRAARLLRRPLEYAQVWFWSAAKGDRAWRWLEPGLWNYERTFAATIDALAPDLIHAHDFRMVGVAVRAAQRARAAGRRVAVVWDAHEHLPGVRPGRDNVRWLPGHRAYVREYAPLADSVVTVSETLADLLQREHHLSERPTVVLNAPALADGSAADAAGLDLRRMCGLDQSTPLMVYAGMVMVHRGLDTVVGALPLLPGVHLALVVNDPSGERVRRLVDAAARQGVAPRVHVLPFVPHEQVVRLLGTADVGLVPLHRWPNYEIALSTKFFEYSHARLPIVVSDVKTMADTVRATGQGEVFRARDVADFARAVRAVLADPRRYRDAYDRPGCLLPTWTWQAQAEVLDSVYSRLVLAAPAGAR
jgi:glycosyltransferase involved in cell wall biosynthesis